MGYKIQDKRDIGGEHTHWAQAEWDSDYIKGEKKEKEAGTKKGGSWSVSECLGMAYLHDIPDQTSKLTTLTSNSKGGFSCLADKNRGRV